MTQLFTHPQDSPPTPSDLPRQPLGQPPSSDPTSNRSLGLKDSLGAALTKQGKYSEATSLLRSVLSTRETLCQSPTSRDMLRTQNNLAAALHHQGHRAEAEAMHRKVLAGDEQTLGEGHPDTVVSMENLASLLVEDADPAKRREGAELRERVRGLRAEGRSGEVEEGDVEGKWVGAGEEAHAFSDGAGQRAMQEGRWGDAESIFRECLGMSAA